MTILTIKGLFPCYHGNITQLVNSRYCVMTLCILAVSHVILVSLYYTTPIHCFCPSHMTGIQCDMIRASCLGNIGSKTYELPEHQVPGFDSPSSRTLLKSSYYELACLILLLQATFFYAPYVISRELTRMCGLQPEELALSALEARRARDPDDRDAAVKDIATHINTFCMRQLRRSHVSYAFRWLHGMKLCLVRLLIQAVYSANVIGQFYMLDHLLGMDFHSLGWKIIGRKATEAVLMLSPEELASNVLHTMGIDVHDLPVDILNIVNRTGTVGHPEVLDTLSVNSNLYRSEPDGVNHDSARIFPTDMLCDFDTTTLGNIQRYTLHCLLPINHLNSVLFHYVWFLLFGVAVVTLTSFIISIIRLILYPCQRKTIRDRLEDLGLPPDGDLDEYGRNIDLFEKEFLRMDGLLLLGYVEAGAGDVISDKTLGDLWDMFTQCSDDCEALGKPRKMEESVLGDVFRVPTDGARVGEYNQPLRTDHMPLQLQDSPLIEMGGTRPSDEQETESFVQPTDYNRPPEYLHAMQIGGVKLNTDDDFMV